MTRKTKQSLVKSILARLRGPYTIEGEEITGDNKKHVISVFYLWISIWLDLPGSDLPGFGRITQVLGTTDVGLLLQGCDSVVQTIRSGKFSTYESFKDSLTHLGSSCTSLIGLCKPGLQQFFVDHDYAALKAVYSFFSFPLRLHLENSERLEKEAEDRFISCQQQKRVNLTPDEREIISSWFPKADEGWAARHYLAHFTSGSSKVGKDLWRKYRDLKMTPRLHYMKSYLESLPYNDQPTFLPADVSEEDLAARVLFVPKSYKAYRMVSLEPTVLTWISNGWAEAFKQYIYEGKTKFSRRYRFNTDKHNAALARVGSATGRYATIDLSSASDSITIDHFRAWFKGSWLYKPGILGRAKYGELSDGSKIELRTFMGMGSRLCFIIETIVFCAIVEAAIKSVGGDPNKSNYRVYGDDIVVEVQYVEAVLLRLEQNGFSVNAEKTFSETTDFLFRESCGGEYLDGADITPVRIPRVNFRWLPSQGKISPGHFQGLIDLANSLSVFPSARHLVIDELRALGPLPLFNEGSLKSPTAVNFDKVLWYNYEYQYYEFEYTDCYTIPVRDRAGRKMKHDHFALAEWLRRAEGRERLLFPEDRVEVEMIPPRTGGLVLRYREA